MQVPTVAQRVIKHAPPQVNSPAYYTDNQLLFEHIIELTSKVEKLTAKHKKLKHKYNGLQHDLYIDTNDEVVDEKIENEITEPKKEKSPQIIPTTIVPPRRANWRNQIQFLQNTTFHFFHKSKNVRHRHSYRYNHDRYRGNSEFCKSQGS